GAMRMRERTVMMEKTACGATYAEVTPEIADLVAGIRKRYRGREEELISMLQSVQRALGYLPEQALLEIARLIHVPAARVYGTVTFYTQFKLQPVGRYIIKVCRGTACHVRGSDRILEDIQSHLDLSPDGTTTDRLFTLETVACFGSCALAPILVVNDTVYGNTDRTRALRLLDDIRAAESVTVKI
ncbi:MAG: NAD(P)H-dependent oxidoreductase subunit E, partial [Thermodesulfobacteriota bacterium]